MKPKPLRFLLAFLAGVLFLISLVVFYLWWGMGGPIVGAAAAPIQILFPLIYLGHIGQDLLFWLLTVLWASAWALSCCESAWPIHHAFAAIRQATLD